MADQADLLAVEIGQTEKHYYKLSAKADPFGTVLSIKWEGVPNRNPSTSGDFVALWQNNGSIPWGTPASKTQSVGNPTPDGDIAFTGLQMATLPYVAAYSVGPDSKAYHNIAAAIPIGAGGVPGTSQPTIIDVAYVGATSLVIDYSTPNGTTPKAFGHTLALVTGATYIPASSTAIASTTPSDLQNDAASFNNITMTMGQTYTVAYLTGVDSTGKPAPSSVAATVTFTVGS